jgi:hypothetical protein
MTVQRVTISSRPLNREAFRHQVRGWKSSESQQTGEAFLATVRICSGTSASSDYSQPDWESIQ